MPLVVAAGVHLAHGTDVVLDGATFALEPGERVGIVGRNGCGKTTLLKILAGAMEADAGSVNRQRGLRIAYLEQQPTFTPGDTLRHAAARAFDRAERAKAALDEVFHALESATPDALAALLAKQARLEAELEAAGGWAVQHKIDAVLHGLGFVDAQFGIPVEGLSGGQRARLGLARLLLDEPDALLLDEPTNHLDIDGCRWLEGFLASEYRGAVAVISHDRWLLDRVVHRIVEIHEGRTREYPGNYEAFVRLRAERHLTQMRVHEKQMDQVRAEERFIARYKAGQRAKQARGRATRLDRFVEQELVERPMELDTMSLRLPRAPRVGDSVARMEGVSKRLGERQLFRHLDFTLLPGDRLGVIGPNGAGKTTFVRVLLGELEADEGDLRCTPRLRAGWFRQSQEHLDGTLTPWQHLQRVTPPRPDGSRLSEQEARNLAGAFLFSGAAQEKELRTLSGGERARAAIAGLVAGAHNLLVLDEPTNHLDIPSAERLEEALEDREGGYDGALVLVSHDRALLERTCTRLLVLDGQGGHEIFEGKYSQWEERRSAGGEAAAKPAPAREEPRREAPSGARKQGPTPKRPRQDSNPRSHLSVAQLEAQEQELAAKVAALDEALADPANARDHARLRALAEERQQAESRRAAIEAEWLSRLDG